MATSASCLGSHSLPCPAGGRSGGVGLTESHPGLPQVQVHAEVCLKAEIHQGDVGAGFTTQSGVLHVAVKYTCTEGSPCYNTPTAPPMEPSGCHRPSLAEAKMEAERGGHCLLPSGSFCTSSSRF